MRYEFAVLYESKAVGKAEVVRQGLYYKVTCRYRLPSDEVYRLIIKWSGGWENIGIPVPEEDGFILVKKIPAKKIPVLDMTFHLIPAGMCPDDLKRTEDAADTEITEEAVSEEAVPNNEQLIIESTGPVFLPVSEDLPFDELDRIENARCVNVNDRPYIAIDVDSSDLQHEPDRAVVGAEDIGIDGGFEDIIPEPV